jgi:hypothetical protein
VAEALIRYPGSKEGMMSTPPTGEELAKLRTDLANSKRFVKKYRRRLGYDAPGRTWVLWDRGRWKVAATYEVEDLARAVADDLWEELPAVTEGADRKSRKATVARCKYTRSPKGLKNMCELAKFQLLVEPD